MTHNSIIVRATWDAEAEVWVASSTDVRGLSVESETFDVLQGKVMDALADLLDLNPVESRLRDIPVHIMAERLAMLTNPAA